MNSHDATRATEAGIPTYLLVPGPESPVNAPVETLAQDLPFHDLAWENFERLCLRVVESESMIEECYEYGTRGQDQHGIDLLTRCREDGSISVYQCKRVKEFGPADIQLAVTKFLLHSWASTSAKFVLCTSNELRTTACANEINAQEKRLLDYNVALEVWNATRLSGKLKKLPEIVYDFFGPTWLEMFCGREHSSLASRRLAPRKVEQYRSRLATFYRNIFEQNDPGIPTLVGQVAPRINLSDRFVLPHLSENETVLSSDSRPKPNPFDLATNREEEAGFGSQPVSSPADIKESREIRFLVDDWISTTDRALIVGIAGSGKTTLLRYILLDLLSPEPTLPAIAKHLGRNLPIWIPFAYWTHTLHREPGASIIDVLRGWFHSWGEDQLFTLVEEAVADERLMLIVDGLDEWVDEATGTFAFAQLQSFLDMRALPALTSARPYALNWLKLSGKWRIARIADLSAQQRRKVCDLWFRLRASLSGEPHNQDAVPHEVSALIENLESSLDLDELSRVPLFLLLLIAIRFQGAALPSGRFDAFESLIRHMLRDHPQRKRSAAAIIPSDQLSEREVQIILARLAYEIQAEQTGGTISQADFEKMLLAILTSDQGSGLGLPSSEARSIAKAFINIEEGSLGLLVPQGMRTFGFLHRSFQERLAAMHCSNKPLKDQVDVFRTYGSNPQWRETLLHVCSMTTRSDELSQLLSALSDSSDKQLSRGECEDFRIEVAFSDFNLPLQELKDLAVLAYNIVELSTDQERRRRILRYCLNGLQARRTRELVQPKLETWSIARETWRSNWFSQLEHWPADDLTKQVLRRGLNDEDSHVIRTSAKAYAKLFHADVNVASDLMKLAEGSHSIEQRAACIEALLLVWPERPELFSISVAAKRTEIPLLHAMGIYVGARLGQVSQEDAVDAIDLASDRIGGPLPYQWNDLLGPLLVEVAKAFGAMIKHACLYAVEENHRPYWSGDAGVDREVAWFVLLTSYGQDAEVLALLATEIGKQHPFLTLDRSGVWRTIASNYRGVKEIERAVDARIDAFNVAQPSEAHYCALLTRSDVAKKKMLKMLQDSFPHWAASALLEGWGIQDPEVAAALGSAIIGNEHRASELGLFIPQILGKTQGRQRLIQLVDHPDAYRLDLVIAGLFQDSSATEDQALISKVIDAVRSREDYFNQNVSALIQYCSENPQVRSIALQNVKSRTPSVTQIAASYSDDWEIRSILSHLMTPLARELRSDIIAALSRSPAIGAQSESILSRWDFESDAIVKTKMSIGYHGYLSGIHSISSETVDALASAAKSYGPDHEERRQAAYCGIGLVKKFEIYFENKERIGEPTGLSIPLDRGLRSNYPFLDFVASHWTEAKDVFGDELLQRFSRYSNESNAWSVLLSVAHQNADLISDAQKAMETYKDLQTSAQGLRFLAKTKPHSPQLRAHALKALNGSGSSWIEFLPIDVACEILLEQFKDDQLALDLEELVRKDRFTNGPLLALCLGWPDCTLVQGLLPHLNSIDGLVAAYAFFSAAAVEHIVDKLPLQLHRAAHSSYWGRYFRRPLVLRLARDPDLGAALFEDMANKPSAWKTCAYPHAIARTQGLNESGRRWVSEEYERQSAQPYSDFGYDFIDSELRSVLHSLRNALIR